jgi:hypothetical protein
LKAEPMIKNEAINIGPNDIKNSKTEEKDKGIGAILLYIYIIII